MDCRIKPGNDETKTRLRGVLLFPPPLAAGRVGEHRDSDASRGGGCRSTSQIKSPPPLTPPRHALRARGQGKGSSVLAARFCVRVLRTNEKTKRPQRDHLPKPNLNGGPPASARDPEKCSCGFRTRSRAEKKGSGAPKGALSSQCPRQARLRAARLAALRLSALALAALATGSTRWLSPRTGFPAALADGCFARFAKKACRG